MLPATPTTKMTDGRFAWWTNTVLGLLPAALACFLALSLAAAMVAPVQKVLSGSNAGWWAGAIYLICTALVAWGVKRADGRPEGLVATLLIALGVVLKTLVVLMFPCLPANIDQSLFRHFATRLAAGGYNEATLSSLSAFYDYPLWTARAFPVHFLVERLGGTHALGWLHALNIAAATAIAALTYAIARRVLPPGKRKWAVFLIVALPFQNFWVSDYSHHLFSSLYLLTFAWVAWELAFGGKGKLRRLFLSFLATVCMVLLSWQRGLDLIAAGLATALVAVVALTGAGVRRTARMALFLFVIPFAGWAMLKGPLLLDRLATCDEYQWSSLLPGFMARGWCPESGGEYCSRYERLDTATPWPEKPRAMYRLALSHMRHQPVETCFLLPWVKTAKLFLVGYASNLEESLALAESPARPSVNWIRRFGTMLFLLCAAWGSIRLAGTKQVPIEWVPILLVPLLTWGAYVLAGETSPRYSVFCQPMLAVIGACAFGGKADGGTSRRVFACRIAGVVLLLAATAGGMVVAIRAMPSQWFYEDLRGSANGTAAQTGKSVFEHIVALPAGERTVTTVLPVPTGTISGSFYSIEFGGAMAGVQLTITAPDGRTIFVVPLEDSKLPEYEMFTVPMGVRELYVTISRLSKVAEGTFTFGYLNWKVH